MEENENSRRWIQDFDSSKKLIRVLGSNFLKRSTIFLENRPSNFDFFLYNMLVGRSNFVFLDKNLHF